MGSIDYGWQERSASKAYINGRSSSNVERKPTDMLELFRLILEYVKREQVKPTPVAAGKHPADTEEAIIPEIQSVVDHEPVL